MAEEQVEMSYEEEEDNEDDTEDEEEEELKAIGKHLDNKHYTRSTRANPNLETLADVAASKVSSKPKKKKATTASKKAPAKKPPLVPKPKAAATKRKAAEAAAAKEPASKKRAPSPAISEASVASTNGEVQVVDAPEGNKDAPEGTKKGTGKRGPRFKDEDDILLAKAYVAATTNPVAGCSQRQGTFFNEVFNNYENLRTAVPPEEQRPYKPQSKLLDRYNRQLKFYMNKWIPHYRSAINQRKSGENDKDVIKRALESYYDEHREHFGFLHVCEILYQLPKFDPRISQDEANEAERERKAIQKSNEVVAVMGAKMDRPIGSKKAKAAKAQARPGSRNSNSAITIHSGSSGGSKQTKDQLRNMAFVSLANTNRLVVQHMERQHQLRARTHFAGQKESEIRSLLAEAKMYREMGMNEEALELMAKVKAVREKQFVPPDALKTTTVPSSITASVPTNLPPTDGGLPVDLDTTPMPPLNVANPFEGCTKGLHKELDDISNSVDELVRGAPTDLADTLEGTQKTTEDDEDD